MKVSSGVFELASRTLVKKCSLPAAVCINAGLQGKLLSAIGLGLMHDPHFLPVRLDRAACLIGVASLQRHFQ